MADPLTLISMGASVAGGGIGAMGALSSGQAQATAANYQAGIAERNKAIALQNANYERGLAEQHAEAIGMKARYQEGLAKATQAASGTDVNRGSNVLVRGSMAEVASLDQAIARNTGARKAFGYETEAANQDAQASLDRMAASTAKTASYYQAATSIVGAAGSVSDKWLKAGQTGVPGFKFASDATNPNSSGSPYLYTSGGTGGNYDEYGNQV